MITLETHPVIKTLGKRKHFKDGLEACGSVLIAVGIFIAGNPYTSKCEHYK